MRTVTLILLVGIAALLAASLAAVADPATTVATTVGAATMAADAPAAPAKKPWFENLRINGYVQARFESRDYDSMSTERDEFTIRRLYMNLIAPLNNETTFVGTFAGVGPDFRDGANLDFENLFIDYTPLPGFSVRFGQGPNFFGLDAAESSSIRIPTERALVAEGNSALGIRGLYALGPSDRGLWVTYDTRAFSPTKEGLRAVVGVQNGQFQDTDKDDHKNVTVDAEYFTEWGQFGASWMEGTWTDTKPTPAVTSDRDAFGVNLRLFPNKLVRNMGFQAEWLRGDWFGAPREGYYGQASYHFDGHPGVAFARVENFDLNRDVANDDYDAVHLGYTYNVTPQDAVTAEVTLGTLGRGASVAGEDDTTDICVQWQRLF